MPHFVGEQNSQHAERKGPPFPDMLKEIRPWKSTICRYRRGWQIYSSHHHAQDRENKQNNIDPNPWRFPWSNKCRYEQNRLLLSIFSEERHDAMGTNSLCKLIIRGNGILTHQVAAIACDQIPAIARSNILNSKNSRNMTG
jgi:hypothetical protein